MTDPYCPREIEVTGYDPYEAIDKKPSPDTMERETKNKNGISNRLMADVCENEDNNAMHPEASYQDECSSGDGPRQRKVDD